MSDIRRGKSRRHGRARRMDAARQWRDGILDEDAPEKVRWSRELKKTKPKVARSEGYPAEELEGTVLEVNRRTCRILAREGVEFSCHLPTNLDLSEFTGMAAGDNVLFSPELGRSGLIKRILPRKNQIIRCAPDDRKHQMLVLAANVDAVIILFSFKQPSFKGRLLDRYLVRMEKTGIDPVICLNKFDLKKKIPAEIIYLKKLGYNIHFCSARSGYGMDGLFNLIQGGKAVVTGPSGVGKSSIIRYFNPDLGVKTGPVRKSDGTGRHITTRSNCYPVSGDTWIIDSPGLREMAVRDIPAEELVKGFRDFDKLAEHCVYRNCRHVKEEGCAVKEAVEKQQVPVFRYQSYLNIVKEP
ncbi:ribosome small subunit-dependent GTPase A [Fibrobacterota bacterium]